MLEKMLALQNKRKKEGGFTLVELIVVLVILAILAALLIPALTGYIDKAKEKSVISETRQCVMAAQTLYDEKYGAATSNTISEPSTTDIEKLAEVSGKVSNVTYDSAGTPANGSTPAVAATYKVKTLTYTGTNGVAIKYEWTSNGGTYTKQ